MIVNKNSNQSQARSRGDPWKRESW